MSKAIEIIRTALELELRMGAPNIAKVAMYVRTLALHELAGCVVPDEDGLVFRMSQD